MVKFVDEDVVVVDDNVEQVKNELGFGEDSKLSDGGL